MKKSLLTAGIAGTFLRMGRLMLPALLMLGATAAAAQVGGTVGQPLQPSNNNGSSNSLVGQWRGVYQGITISLLVQANGQYTQIAQKGSLVTQQSGPYRLVAPNTFIFSVTSWAPKTMPVYHPTGTTGGYYTQQPITKPPGGTDTYVFQGPNTVVIYDQVTHGNMTLNRVK
jgi:hypothetical protein